MSQRAILARALAHDVGKYLARAARNLPAEGPVPAVLVDMLRRDLYAPSPSGLRPEQRFEVLVAELEPADQADARIAEARAGFASIAQLEAAVASAEPSAVRAAGAAARQIEDTLRALAREVSEAEGT